MLQPSAIAVQPSHLVPPSFAHLHEAPGLAPVLERIAVQRLAARQRFPHTLLLGPKGSSKQAVAHLIAAEMAAELHVVDVGTLVSQEELHKTLRKAGRGDIVLVAGLDLASPVLLRDLARAARGRMPIADRPRPDSPWQSLVAPAGAAERPLRPYADFTVIATLRDPEEVPMPRLDWFEQTFHLRRTVATEAVRIERVLRRVGLGIDAAGSRSLAEYAVRCSIPTLPCVSAVADWMWAEGLQTVGWQQVDRMAPTVLEYHADAALLAKVQGARATAEPTEDVAGPEGAGGHVTTQDSKDIRQ